MSDDPSDDAAEEPPDSLGAAVRGALRGPGRVEVEHDGAVAQVDVVEAGPIGVRVDGLRVRPADPAPLELRARHIARGLRPGGERLVEVEVDPTLGGATLRSDPRDMRGGGFYEVELDREGARVHRQRVGPDGSRSTEPFPLTHDELERAVDRLDETPPEAEPAPHPLDAVLGLRGPG